MAIRASKDELAVIWILSRLGWSLRRIARLKLPSSHHTIASHFETAREMIESCELPISAMDGGRKVRLRYCGDSRDIERIDAVRNSGLCGGGKKAKAHIYDSDFKDTSNED